MKTLKFYIEEFTKLETKYKFAVFTIIFFHIGLITFPLEELFGSYHLTETMLIITVILMITTTILDEISRRKG